MIRDYVFRVESVEPDRLTLTPVRKASRQQRRHQQAADMTAELAQLKADLTRSQR